MSYVPYLSLVCKRLVKKETPRILEIGIDIGQTYNVLASVFQKTFNKFQLTGVDVIVRDIVKSHVQKLKLNPEQSCELIQDNSLYVLPKLIEENRKFDIIFIDGDHNYYTVQRELEFAKSLIDDEGVIVLDDYHGKWGTRDLWYATRDTHKNCDIVSEPIETEKCGVKPAVDEFVEKNKEWKLSRPLTCEAVILSR